MSTETLEPSTEVITLGQAGIETSNFDRYTGRKNVTDRIALLGPLIRGFSYYHNSKKFLAPADPALLKMVKDQLGDPTQYFATVVFHYAADEEGELSDIAKCSGKIKLWRWSESKYEEYSALQKKWPIMDMGFGVEQKDLIIKCTEEKYQRMTTLPAPNAHWKTKQAWYDALKAKAAKAAPKLSSTIGFKMTNQEIMDLLGASSSNPTTGGKSDTAGDVDLSDVIEEA